MSRNMGSMYRYRYMASGQWGQGRGKGSMYREKGGVGRGCLVSIYRDNFVG